MATPRRQPRHYCWRPLLLHTKKRAATTAAIAEGRNARHRGRREPHQTRAQTVLHYLQAGDNVVRHDQLQTSPAGASNLLDQRFDVVTAPNRVWVADVSYVPTHEVGFTI